MTSRRQAEDIFDVGGLLAGRAFGFVDPRADQRRSYRQMFDVRGNVFDVGGPLAGRAVVDVDFRADKRRSYGDVLDVGGNMFDVGGPLVAPILPIYWL